MIELWYINLNDFYISRILWLDSINLIRWVPPTPHKSRYDLEKKTQKLLKKAKTWGKILRWATTRRALSAASRLCPTAAPTISGSCLTAPPLVCCTILRKPSPVRSAPHPVICSVAAHSPLLQTLTLATHAEAPMVRDISLSGVPCCVNPPITYSWEGCYVTWPLMSVRGSSTQAAFLLSNAMRHPIAFIYWWFIIIWTLLSMLCSDYVAGVRNQCLLPLMLRQIHA
jgi:hypothetical protein